MPVLRRKSTLKDKLAPHLSKRFDVSESRAQTLMQTESALFFIPKTGGII